MTGQIESISRTFGGKGHVTVSLRWDDSEMQRLEVLKGQDVEITIKAKSKRRSLTANAYFWVLVGKLAERLGIPKEEIYLEQIKRVGVFQPMAINVEAFETFKTAWGNNGLGFMVDELGEKDGLMEFLAYYGSSTYSTKQMARLIDSTVEECKVQGIETMTPEELSLLKERWA